MDYLTELVIKSKRSWWQVRYYGGMILSEWDTLQGNTLLPTSNGRTSRWEDIPKRNIASIRLVCPNGLAGEIEATNGKFFQLKTGYFGIGQGSFCAAHIIGVITSSKGDCLCRAWETGERRLIEFKDNVLSMKYRQIGMLNLDIQGVRL